MPRPIAIAEPPNPSSFTKLRQLADKTTSILMRQALEHLHFYKDRVVWRTDPDTFLPICPDGLFNSLEKRQPEECRNRDALRDSIQDEVQQILTDLVGDCLFVHYGGTKALPVPMSLVAALEWQSVQRRYGETPTRAENKNILELTGLRLLHARTVAITLLNDVRWDGPLSKDWPIVQELVEVARAYLHEDEFYGFELLVTVGPPNPRLEIIAGHKVGWRDSFVRFV